MARKELIMEELIEVLYQWHKGYNISQIKRSLGLDRKTIRKYINLGQSFGLSRDVEVDGNSYFPELAGKIQRELKTPAESSYSYKKTAAYQTAIEKLMSKQYMTPKQVYRILAADHGYTLSYTSFKRYMAIKYPKQPGSCLRIEVMAAEEAQVDFGRAGMMFDPEKNKMRRAYAFVLTLSYSRLPYVEFVFDQGQVTWVKCHMNAFTFFGGTPKRIVLDNLKSGVLKPSAYDPVFNKTYAECSKHYGFIIDPAKIRRGDHKGKVERKVIVVRQQFLSSLETADIAEANKKVKPWCTHGYGMEIHGTTKKKPYEVFQTQEKERLLSLPVEKFDIPLWKKATVHRDYHIVFDNSYYSLPDRYIGKKVWARGGFDSVQIFYEGELIKIHRRAFSAGTRVTDENDYPPEKSKYLIKSVSHYQQEAFQHGEFVFRVVTKIMTEQSYRNVSKVQGVFRLAEKYGSDALNLTCKRCLFYEDYRMNTIKRILEKQLYRLPPEEPEAGQGNASSSFIRPSEYFTHN